MTDPSLAGAWVQQMNGLISQAVWMAGVSFAILYAGALGIVMTRFASARRRYAGGI